ncbi:MAG: hypothetical protein Q9210_002174 [Variospora velana]
MAIKERSGIAVGLNKGHKTTPREFKPRISRTKGHLSKRTAFVREIVKEVSGYVESFNRTPRVDRVIIRVAGLSFRE